MLSRSALDAKQLSALGTVIVLAFLQIAFWPSWDNITVVAGCSIGGAISVAYFSRQFIWAKFPLSAISLAGFSLYYFWLPMIVLLAEFRPVAYSLVSPSRVAFHSILGFLVLVSAHIVYRREKHLQKLRRSISLGLLKPLGIYTAPTTLQAFLIGGIGLSAGMLELMTIEPGVEEANRGVVAKLLHGFSPFFTFPYLLALPAIFGLSVGKSATGTRTWLFGYSGLIVVYGIMRNSRTAIFYGFAALMIAIGWGHLSGRSPSRFARPVPLVVAALLLIFITSQAADLATAMVLARGERAESTPAELLERTWAAYQDKHAIESYRTQGELTYSGIADERYVSNVFFARLCNLRFLDISLDLQSGMQLGQRDEILQFETQRVLSILPRPMLGIIGLNANKDFVGSMSSGDHMLAVGTGDAAVAGGFRTGSMLGNGLTALGWWYLPLLFFVAIPTYLLMDTFSVETEQKQFCLSPLCMTLLFPFLFYWTSGATGCESFSALFGFILRGWIQSIVLYVCLFWSTRFLAPILLPRQK